MKCPKCQGEMIEGMITHRTQGLVPATNGSVIWGTSLKKNFVTMFTVENAKQLKSFRCKDCGYLENYAN